MNKDWLANLKEQYREALENKDPSFPDLPGNAQESFEYIAERVVKLPLKDVVLDVGFKSGGILVFHLILPHQLSVSISKSFRCDKNLEDVEYSVSMNHEFIEANPSKLAEFMKALEEYISDMEEWEK